LRGRAEDRCDGMVKITPGWVVLAYGHCGPL
jgi:hypothetical protein